MTLALILLLAATFLFGAATITAHAKPLVYGSDSEDLVVANSRLTVEVVDYQDKLPWSGHIAGPNGNLAWDAPDSVGWSTIVYDHHDLEAGTYTAIGDSPIAPGWHVVAAMVVKDVSPIGACIEPASSFNDPPSVTLSAQDTHWVVCLAVERDGAIFGSDVALHFVSQNFVSGPWTGVLTGPNSVNYSLATLMTGNPDGVAYNVLPGTWNLVTSDQPKPGYAVVGYHRFETDSDFPDCPTDPNAYGLLDHTVTVSAAHPNWAICVFVTPSVPNSSLWVTMVTDGFPPVWDGSVHGPNGYARTFTSIGVGAASHSGFMLNVAGGIWSVDLGNPPALGYTVKGFSIFDGDAFATCPASAVAYGANHSFQITAQHPNMLVCILLDHPTIVPNSRLSMAVVAPGNGSGQDWNGTIDGPGSFDWTWKSFGIDGLNYASNAYAVAGGTYTFAPGKPVKPGWAVKGYLQVETDDPLPTCPSDPSLYGPNNVVTISQAHPKGSICVFIAKAVTPTVTPTTTATAFVPPVIPWWEPETPQASPTSTPSATPTTAKPTSTPQSPSGEPQVPANGEAGGESSDSPKPDAGSSTVETTAHDAPLPPNTGSSATPSQDGTPMMMIAGLILVAGAALAAAASRARGLR
jgi:hypothetical protein